MKYVIAGLLCALPLFAQTPTITTDPNPATAITGGTVSLTSSIPVTWGLASGSSGTITTIDSTHATYHAPSSGITPVHMIAGCPAVTNDSIWVTPMDSLPLESVSRPSAANWLANVSSDDHFHIGDVEWPGISIADATAGTHLMKFYYGSYGDSFVSFPTPSITNLYREGGAFRGGKEPGVDHHVYMMRTSDCHTFETYNDWLNGHTENCADGTSGCTGISGGDWAWNNYSMRPGTGAAGIPDPALTLHADEVRDGTVNHLLRFVTCSGCMGTEGVAGQPGTTYWPGQFVHGNANPDYPPYGAIFRLKASVTGDSLCGTASNLATTYCHNIVDGLHKHGLILADISNGPAKVEVGVDCTTDGNVMGAIGKLGFVPTSDFETVDVSSLKTQSPQPNAGGWAVDVTQGGANYVKPTSFAVVTAAPIGGGTTIMEHIALRPIGIGFYNLTINVAAGTPGFQIPYWVTGTSAGFEMNTGATWTITQSAGTGESITAGGVYTAPPTATGVTQGILTATSVDDPSISYHLYVNVFPTGNSPVPGTIRIDTGRTSNFTDGNGNLWLADTFMEAGGVTKVQGDYPAPWPYDLKGSPEEKVYESSAGTTGNVGDFIYRFFVPNGNYKVRLMFGRTAQPWGLPQGTFNIYNSADIQLMTQGIVQKHLYNYSVDPNVMGLIQRHADVYIPARVTSNYLNVSLMGYWSDALQLCPDPANCGSDNEPYLNGVEIIPDNTDAPYWQLDNDRQVTRVAAGSTTQFYVTDWWSGKSDAVWSISGPGSIDQTGKYTAPATAPAGQTPVTIQAKSASDPTLIATWTLAIDGGSAVQFK